MNSRNKNIQHIMLFVLICIHSIPLKAQYTLSLDNFKIYPDIKLSIPQRDIIHQDNSIVVSYKIDLVNIFPDTTFKTSNTIHIDGFGYNTNEGEPLFPIRWDYYALDGDLVTIEVIDSSYIEIPLEMSPARKQQIESRYLTHSDTVIPIKPYNGFFPDEVVKLSNKKKIQNRYVVSIQFKPIQYNYEAKTARIFKKISYRITSSNENHTPVQNNSLNYINNIVENPLTLNYNEDSYAMPLAKEYLIITSNSLQPAAELFAEWKRILGFRTQVIHKQVWTSSEIHSAINSFKNPNNSQYILLLGDENNVPPASYYQENGFMFPKDINYLDFDSISNSILPEIFMGRIPVSNLQEAQIVLSKIYNYEKDPPIQTPFYENVLASSYFQQGSTPGYASQNYVESTEQVRDYLITKGKSVHRNYYTQASVYPLYYRDNHPVPQELQKPFFSWDGDYADIINHINSGSFLVIHRDHGWEQRWYAPKFDVVDIESLNNTIYLPIVFSIDCQTGEYDYIDESFVEKFLKHQQGGCVGMIAATGTTPTTSNNFFMKGLIDAIWPNPGILSFLPNDNRTPIYRLGEIMYCGLERANQLWSQLKNKQLYHCFGDPSMCIYTDCPANFSNISIYRNTDSVTVDTGNDMAYISFYDKTNDEVSSFFGTYIEKACDPNNTIVSIAGYNKRLYLDDPNCRLFIQNDTIDYNVTHNCDIIKVGSYVDINSTFGPVTFSGNRIVLKGREVELHGNTTINTGSEFIIKNE